MNFGTKFNLFVLSGSHSVNSVYNRMLTPVLPLILSDFNLSYSQVGLIVSAYAAGNFVFQYPISFAADYTGRRRTVLVFSLLMNSLPVIFMGFADTYGFLLFLVFLSGVGSSAYHPAAVALVAREIPGRRGLGLGLFKAGGDFGSVFTPLVVAWLTGVLSDDWRTAAQWMVLPGLIWVVLVAVRFKDSAPSIESSGRAGQSNFLGLMLSNGLELFRNRTLALLMVLSSCRVMCLRGMIAFIPLLLAEGFGYDTAGVGWIMTAYFIFGTGSSILQGILSGRFEHTSFIIGMMMAGTLAFALIPLSGSVWMLFPVLALLASSIGPTQGPILAVTTEAVGDKNQASSVGLLYTMNEVSGMISPFVGGLIAQKIGLQRAFFFYSVIALLATGASVLLHWWTRELQRREIARP